MGVGDWLGSTVQSVRTGDVDGIYDSGYQLYAGFWRRVGQFYNYGTPVYTRDWDLLVILDACRYDLIEEVSDEYEFLTRETVNSVGSATEEWMAKNFVPEYAPEMADTVYVTANPHSSEDLGEGLFHHLEEVWTHSWNDDLGTVRAETTTDYAIAAGRQLEADRYLVHYMQPHHPFVQNPGLNEGIGFGGEAEFDHVWEKLRKGAISRETVWKGYVQNLRYVLDSVKRLLRNFDAETAVISSDHGNAMGEYGLYGHPMYVPLRILKRVPYIRTQARDRGTANPAVELTLDRKTSDNVKERLRDLGYA